MPHKKNYIFTNRRQSNKAIVSTILGIISGISLIVVIYLTFRQGGVAPVKYGVSTLFITIFSIIGFILGILSIKESDRYRLFCILGTIINFIIIACISGILYMGSW